MITSYLLILVILRIFECVSHSIFALLAYNIFSFRKKDLRRCRGRITIITKVVIHTHNWIIFKFIKWDFDIDGYFFLHGVDQGALIVFITFQSLSRSLDWSLSRVHIFRIGTIWFSRWIPILNVASRLSCMSSLDHKP